MAAPTLNPMQKVRRHKIQDIKKKSTLNPRQKNNFNIFLKLLKSEENIKK